MATRIINPLALGERKPPTKQHRPAIWECMLGTLYAADPDGNVEYFDYDYAAAKRHAKVRKGRNDLRTYRRRPFRDTGYMASEQPRSGQLVLWRRAS